MAGWLPRLFTQRMPRVRPMTEMGVSGTPVYAGYVLSPERSSKLIGQEKYRTFSELLANTSIVAAGVRYFLNIVAKPSWSLEPADKSSKAKEIAELTEDILFEDLHTPWSRVVRRSGTYRFHGFAIQEWTAKKRDDGKIGFHDIESRPQWTIWRWEVDERGTVIGAWQRDPLTGRELGLPRGKIMYLVDDTPTDNPEGMGLLRHCVEPAERLKMYLQQEAFGYLRDLHGIPLGRAPIDELQKAVGNKQITQQQMDTALQDLKRFVQIEKVDVNTALVLNSTPYYNVTDAGLNVSSEKKWDLELVSGDAPGLVPINAAITRLNTEIARVLGVEHLLLGADAAGSYALAKEKATDLYLLANSVLRDIRLQVQHDILWPLWSLNGWPDELMPNLKTEDVSPKDVEQIGRVLREMATSGAPLQPDDEVQNFVRDLLGAPHVDLDKLRQQYEQQQEQQQQQLEAQQGQQPQTGKAETQSPIVRADDVKEADNKAANGKSGQVARKMYMAKALVDNVIANSSNGHLEALHKIQSGIDDLIAKFEESKHPRDAHGRFSSGGGDDGAGKASEEQKSKVKHVLDRAKRAWKTAKPVLAEVALVVGSVALSLAIGIGFSIAEDRYKTRGERRGAGKEYTSEDAFRDFHDAYREEQRRRPARGTTIEDEAVTATRVKHGVRAAHVMALYLRPGTAGEKEAARQAMLRMGIDPATFGKALHDDAHHMWAAIDHLLSEHEAERILSAILDNLTPEQAEQILAHADALADPAVKIEKMVPYKEGKPYQWEDKVIASKPGTPDGSHDEDEWFGWPGFDHGKHIESGPTERDLSVGRAEATTSGDNMVPGSGVRGRAKGRRRVV